MRSRNHQPGSRLLLLAALVGVSCLPLRAQQTQPPPYTPAPSANSPAQGPQTQSPQTASPVQAQTQQSQQPARPASPQPGQGDQPAAPFSGSLVGGPAAQQQQQQTAAPAQTTPQVPAPQGPPQPGRESVVPAAPAEVRLEVPQVAPGFRAAESPFPVLDRVGVDMGQQRPITMREAIELALANNKDIEVARQNVRVAEFDLRAARGVYDPRF
ncbi:MAG TPA: hypothetical protein VG148_12415, partial [Pyrinomonadaceae bacterium]|nr:hypothetical protein [Pyrinomonadaceae bacterium]